MKKIIFTLALVALATCGYAQKKNVKLANSKSASSENPDFEAARAAIRAALQDESTLNLTETWYTAGLIGYREAEFEKNDSYNTARPTDQRRIGMAVIESIAYWQVADSLSLIPDAKGKLDTKTHKSIQNKLLDYYRNQYLVLYAVKVGEDDKDRSMAYDAIMLHLSIPDMSMMQEERLQKQMVKDTTYYQYLYYAGLYAVQAERHEEAIAVFEQIKDKEYERNTVYQFLYQEYRELNDTVHFVATLKEATEIFPSDMWFLQNLINYYIFSNRHSEAIDYLKDAINRTPNDVQLYTILGNIYSNAENYEEAESYFNQALAIDANSVDALSGIGRLYYNQAVKINEAAADINVNDKKAYAAAQKEMNETYAKALPFFERAHDVAPDNRDVMVVLRSLYYRFKMQDKYDAINAEMNGNNLND